MQTSDPIASIGVQQIDNVIEINSDSIVSVDVQQVENEVTIENVIVIRETPQNVILFTTPKTELSSNRMLLPSVPSGDLFLNMMLLFENLDDNHFELIHGVTVQEENGNYYGVIDSAEKFEGYGKVSYLAKV